MDRQGQGGRGLSGPPLGARAERSRHLAPVEAPWTLDPSVSYLNHGAFGAAPRVVQAAQQAYRDRLEQEPTRFLVHELEPQLDRVRERVAALVGAPPEELVFVANATTAVSTVLASLRLSPGDELLITDHGYNACNNAARFYAERAGARVTVAALPFPFSEPEQLTQALLAAVTPRTRVALLDHVTSPTGLIFPLAAMVAALRERGVLTLVDGAHAPGMLELDLERLGADYYTGNLHKWLCAPKTAAFLHVPRRHQAGLRPLVLSHGASSPRADRPRLWLEFDWTGTFDPSAVLSVPAALTFLEGLVPGGLPGLYARNRALALAARRLIAERLGLRLPCPDGAVGALASLPLPGPSACAPGAAGAQDPLAERLWQRHRIEVPVFSWPAAGGRLLRVSAQVYNELQQYERLAEALLEELEIQGAG